jgi:hypothetical protein
MAPAVAGEIDDWNGTVPLNADESQVLGLLGLLTGAPDILETRRYGSAMVVSFERGDGEVFNAGTTEWVNGLTESDPFIDQITRNVLDRALMRPR